MNTTHKILFADSRNLKRLDDNSIDLVVTSPPYPMIEMWDDLFMELNPDVGKALKVNKGQKSFELMHNELDKVWVELERVVKPGGFVCINIGDATRTIGNNFRLYSNHSRINNTLTTLSFENLPLILWRKTTNAPNKFMGSGMLPSGAYVTLEHEYILVFRKGGKKNFTTDNAKKGRNESAIFWEERNKWFSDLWDLSGVRQSIQQKKLRERSAAYPFELSYRLINMYSVKGDTVLDPFLGTGTTIFSAITSGRNSVGVEYDNSFKGLISGELQDIKQLANKRISERIDAHLEFAKKYQAEKRELKYINNNHGFPVMTRQERNIKIDYIDSINFDNHECIEVNYNTLKLLDNPSGEILLKNE
jgi:DNA modification methylase